MSQERDGLDVLTRDQCLALLRQVPVGRVAVVVGGLPVVVPVNFIMFENDVVFRTGTGTKLAAAVAGSVVAFEADAIEPQHRSGWSVLVAGRASEMDSEERDAVVAAGLETWAPGREHVVRIRPEMISGRRLRGSGSRLAIPDTEWDWSWS